MTDKIYKCSTTLDRKTWGQSLHVDDLVKREWDKLENELMVALAKDGVSVDPKQFHRSVAYEKVMRLEDEDGLSGSSVLVDTDADDAHWSFMILTLRALI